MTCHDSKNPKQNSFFTVDVWINKCIAQRIVACGNGSTDLPQSIYRHSVRRQQFHHECHSHHSEMIPFWYRFGVSNCERKITKTHNGQFAWFIVSLSLMHRSPFNVWQLCNGHTRNILCRNNLKLKIIWGISRLQISLEFPNGNMQLILVAIQWIVCVANTQHPTETNDYNFYGLNNALTQSWWFRSFFFLFAFGLRSSSVNGECALSHLKRRNSLNSPLQANDQLCVC